MVSNKKNLLPAPSSHFPLPIYNCLIACPFLDCLFAHVFVCYSHSWHILITAEYIAEIQTTNKPDRQYIFQLVTNS